MHLENMTRYQIIDLCNLLDNLAESLRRHADLEYERRQLNRFAYFVESADFDDGYSCGVRTCADTISNIAQEYRRYITSPRYVRPYDKDIAK